MSQENGIWLCQNCAKLVDNDEAKYTVEKLREWKSDAEEAAARALERRQAPAGESEGVFLEAERLMPELIGEMREDVRRDDSELIREFILLPGPLCSFNSKKRRFTYYEETHPDLQLEVDFLEEMGMVTDVSTGDTPIYRMVPELVDWLRKSE